MLRFQRELYIGAVWVFGEVLISHAGSDGPAPKINFTDYRVYQDLTCRSLP